MNRIPPVVRYTVLRLLAFAIPLALLLLTPLQGWVSAIVAAIVGLCVSYIFLRTPRDSVARELYERRHGEAKPKQDDEDEEDAVLDLARDTKADSDADPAASAAEAGRVEEREAEDDAERELHEPRQS